jgi:hypothetical protein
MDIRENSLWLHGKGYDLGILRLYLTPLALGAAQDDRVRWHGQGRLLLRDAGRAGAAASGNAERRTAFIDADDVADGTAPVTGVQARNEHCVARASIVVHPQAATAAFACVAADKPREFSSCAKSI